MIIEFYHSKCCAPNGFKSQGEISIFIYKYELELRKPFLWVGMIDLIIRKIIS